MNVRNFEVLLQILLGGTPLEGRLLLLLLSRRYVGEDSNGESCFRLFPPERLGQMQKRSTGGKEICRGALSLSAAAAVPKESRGRQRRTSEEKCCGEKSI